MAIPRYLVHLKFLMKVMIKYLFTILFLFSLVLFGCKGQTDNQSKGEEMNINIISSAFSDGELIPPQYTCDGSDISPQLEWDGIPEGTKEIALICDDPDAPMGTWVHWVLYNIPPGVNNLPEGVSAITTLKNGAVQGTNDFHKIGYGGPCPPSGTHRYFFKLYALDAKLNLKPGKTKTDLLAIMEGHIIAEGQLMGKYKR